MVNRLRLWLRSLLLRRRLEREMREEIADHLERATARLVARGLSPAAARRQAEREFGNVARLQEQARDARGTAWLDAAASDVRFAVRHFARAPLVTATMFVVLAVGLAISALLFSYVHSYATLPPPGIERDADLVRIRGSRSAGADGRGVRTFGEEEFRAYGTLDEHFTAVAGWLDTPIELGAGAEGVGDTHDARAAFVTENYFAVMGVRPILGAGLAAYASHESSSSSAAVIGHAVWERLFGRDPAVIGSTVSVNGVPVTVVGVAPATFKGVAGFSRFHVWLPLSARRLLPAPPTEYRAAARLRPGVGASEATAAVQVVAARAAASSDERILGEPSAEVVPLLAANGDPMFDRDVTLMSLSVGLLGLLVLLIACTNASALLTGLAMARRQEIAVRLSLGATRPRLIRQLLTESALLAGAAGAAALGITALVLGAVARFVPALPMQLGVGWPAAAFTFGVALAVGVLFGLSPALHATRLTLAGALRDSTTSIVAPRARLQRGLVVAQIAFTQPLTVLLAAVLVVVVGQMQPRSRSDVAEELITVTFRAASAEGAGRASMRRVLDRLPAVPGVASAAIDWRGMVDLGSYMVHPEDRVEPLSPAARLSGVYAAEGYFALMDIPIVRGREFAAGDAAPLAHRVGGATFRRAGGEAAAIISAELAKRMWGAADPVGRRLRPADDSATGARDLVVVGVVDDPLARDRRTGEDPRIYLPPDTAWFYQTLIVRTDGPAAPLLPAVRALVQREAPGMVAAVQTVAESEAVQARHFATVTAGIAAAGLMALLLSAIGLYAVVAFAVGQRTREIAVRIAVGGGRHRIAGRFVADGLRLGALGLAFGMPLSLLGLHALAAAIPDVPPVSLPAVTVVAAAGVIAVATAAAWLPARRAASVDPATTLRAE